VAVVAIGDGPRKGADQEGWEANLVMMAREGSIDGLMHGVWFMGCHGLWV
jgi:hypothetical protein